jgi:hypothetical protein
MRYQGEKEVFNMVDKYEMLLETINVINLKYQDLAEQVGKLKVKVEELQMNTIDNSLRIVGLSENRAKV